MFSVCHGRLRKGRDLKWQRLAFASEHGFRQAANVQPLHAKQIHKEHPIASTSIRRFTVFLTYTHLGVVTLSSLVLKVSRSASVLITTLSSSTPLRWDSSCARDKMQRGMNTNVIARDVDIVDQQLVGVFAVMGRASERNFQIHCKDFVVLRSSLTVSSKGWTCTSCTASPVRCLHRPATWRSLVSRHRHSGRHFA